jgi:TRAP-type C4-dicarboxylate transport system permease small subunit
LGGLWKRLYWEIGVPSLYLVFSLITINAPWNEAGTFLRHTLSLGFSQMYFIVVLFQFYLLFPLLQKLMRATRHHGVIMAVSLAFAMVIGHAEHYPSRLLPMGNVLHWVNSVLPMSRDFLSHQELCIAGMLVALHLDQVLDFVSRRWRQILIVRPASLGYLPFSGTSGNTVERASDIYEPASVLWCFAAIAGMLSISWWWDQRTPGTRRARSLSLPASLAALTGCVFFAHTLFINIIPLHPRCDGAENEPSLVGHRRYSLWRHSDRDVHVRRTDHPNAPPSGTRRAVRAEQRASYNGTDVALEIPANSTSENAVVAIDLGMHAARR